MGIINVLDFQIANLIAAGEVVDRPASVVKELLENAIDAGASHITAEIKNGGSSLIRVGDDGCGMSREDVSLCILRHATSKIKNAEDLDGIRTLGFRGEALAAIASVSKLRIITKRAQDSVGTLLVCESGKITDITDTGCRNGTTVIAEELFANIPARRKFLKRDATEAMAVYAAAEKIALSRPDIAIRFISDGNIKFDSAGDGILLNTIYAVLGRDFAKKMINVNGMTDGVEVNGFIGTPDNVRGNRNYQNLFINGRYIKSNVITGALEDAFNSYIPADRFPCCVLNVIVHPAFVDVNVHPAKLEVKFSNEKIIYNGVYCAVRNALAERIKRPELKLRDTVMTGEDVRIINAFTSLTDKITDEDEKKEEQVSIFSDEAETTITEQNSAEKALSGKTPETIKENEPSEQYTYTGKIQQPILRQSAVSVPEPGGITEKKDVTIKEKTPGFYRILGTAFNSYIFIEAADKVLIIDKHAAHERIIFEEMKRNMQRSDRFSQLTLIPPEVRLTAAECAALTEYKKDIVSTGMDFYIKGNDAYITAVPAGLSADSALVVLCELAGRLSDGTGSVGTGRDMIFERALYQAACKAALKAGREDSEPDIAWICDGVMRLPDIKYCPHGRPVAYELSKHEIERQFGRT